MKNEDIHERSVMLAGLLVDAEKLVSSIKAQLEIVQGECTHERAEEYRRHWVGSCPYCGEKFMANEDVDRIYSE